MERMDGPGLAGVSTPDIISRLDAAAMNLSERSDAAARERFEALRAEAASRLAPYRAVEVWTTSEQDAGWFSIPRTEEELRVYFEVCPDLADQREAGTRFDDWLEENERFGLLERSSIAALSLDEARAASRGWAEPEEADLAADAAAARDAAGLHREDPYFGREAAL